MGRRSLLLILFITAKICLSSQASIISRDPEQFEDEEAGYNSFEDEDDSLDADDGEQYSRRDFAKDEFDDGIEDREMENYDADEEDEELYKKKLYGQEDSFEEDEDESYRRQDFAKEDQFEDDTQDREPENDDSDEEDDLAERRDAEEHNENDPYNRKDSFEDGMMEDDDRDPDFDKEDDFSEGVGDYNYGNDEREDLAEDENGLFQERKSLDEEISALQIATGKIKNQINTLMASFDSVEAGGNDDSEEVAQGSKQQRQYDFQFSLVK